MILQIRQILLFIFLTFVLSSCSSSEEQEEKGVIEQTTDAISQEAIDRIKTPIDQAKLAKELMENHNRTVEEAVKQQE